MKINFGQLIIENDKRELKRYASRHALNSALVLYVARYHEKLSKRGRQ